MTIRQGNKIIAGNINVEDYNTLQNKPRINSVELNGNKSLDDLGIQAKGDYALKSTTLAGYGITDGLSTSQITNCITKIPQDIKLELNENGTLTLKAGSKVYVPNGAGKFDVVTVQSDKSWGQTTYASGNIMLFYRSKYNDLFALNDYACYSGTSSPTAINNMIWYDTANGKIKWTNNKGSNWNDEGLSLPLNNSPYTNGTGFTSIDQVFNGFGYIGNSWFRLQGVKPLYPNGFNTDGSYNNISTESTKVDVYTPTNNRSGDLVIESNGIVSGVVKEINSKSDAAGFGNYYVLSENKHYYYNDSTWTHLIRANIGKVTYDSTGRITSFNPKTTFQAVDRNDTEWASTASKPSKKYTNINLTASGTKLIMPDNGFIYCIVDSVANSRLAMYDSDFPYRNIFQIPNTNAGHIGGGLLVKKGDSITIDYSGTIVNCIFTYDEGSK